MPPRKRTGWFILALSEGFSGKGELAKRYGEIETDTGPMAGDLSEWWPHHGLRRRGVMAEGKTMGNSNFREDCDRPT